MVTLRVSPSACNEMFQGWSLQKAFRFLSETGYEAVELAPFTLAERVTEIRPERRLEVRRLAREYGLEIAGLHWLLVSPTGLHLTHPEASVRAKTRNYLLELVEFCADIGGHVLVFGSPRQRNVEPGVTYAKAWNWAVESFRGCARLAEARGVILCVEPLSRTQTNFINTASEAIRLIEAVGSPHFRLVLDVASMCDEGKPLEEIILGAAPYLAHFHANDDNRRGPGMGGADYRSIVRALREIDYQGYVSVEPFDFKPDPETVARESLRNLKSFLGAP